MFGDSYEALAPGVCVWHVAQFQDQLIRSQEPACSKNSFQYPPAFLEQKFPIRTEYWIDKGHVNYGTFLRRGSWTPDLVASLRLDEGGSQSGTPIPLMAGSFLQDNDCVDRYTFYTHVSYSI